MTGAKPYTGFEGTALDAANVAFLAAMKACSSSPAKIKANLISASGPPGTKVTVTNKDGTGHTWTSDTKAFDNPVAPGATVSFTFDQKGTFSYHCNIHPSMTGTVTVT